MVAHVVTDVPTRARRPIMVQCRMAVLVRDFSECRRLRRAQPNEPRVKTSSAKTSESLGTIE